jgi:hypothetical protein
VTPSAPVICFQGSTNRTNGFLAHLNPSGALIDATYLGNSAGSDVISIGGLLRLPGGSVLVAGDESGVGAVSKVQFGSGGWTAPACLSTNVLNGATQVGSGGVAPGELVTLTGFESGLTSVSPTRPTHRATYPRSWPVFRCYSMARPYPYCTRSRSRSMQLRPLG